MNEDRYPTKVGPQVDAEPAASDPQPPSRWRRWGKRMGVGVFVFYTIKGLVWLAIGAFLLLAGNCGN